MECTRHSGSARGGSRPPNRALGRRRPRGGGRPGGSIVDQTEADWDWTFDLCLKATWLFMKHVLPRLSSKGGSERGAFEAP